MQKINPNATHPNMGEFAEYQKQLEEQQNKIILGKLCMEEEKVEECTEEDDDSSATQEDPLNNFQFNEKQLQVDDTDEY